MDGNVFLMKWKRGVSERAEGVTAERAISLHVPMISPEAQSSGSRCCRAVATQCGGSQRLRVLGHNQNITLQLSDREIQKIYFCYTLS
jgi:hypothetical protein